MSERLDSRRVTIADIARRAGVSKGAVSYALNGRPGLSDVTRARILGIANGAGARESPRFVTYSSHPSPHAV